MYHFSRNICFKDNKKAGTLEGIVIEFDLNIVIMD